MKSKRLFQTFVVLVLLFSSFGGSQPAFASADAAPAQDPIVINRSLDVWNATYIGYVSGSIHEKWQLDLTEPHNFVVSANTVAGDLVPLLILRDANGLEITRGVGSLTSSQPAGTYYIEVQPDSGAGFYFLTIRQVEDVSPSASTVVNPTTVDVGGTATVTVNLNNVPAEGYTSADTPARNSTCLQTRQSRSTTIKTVHSSVASPGTGQQHRCHQLVWRRPGSRGQRPSKRFIHRGDRRHERKQSHNERSRLHVHSDRAASRSSEHSLRGASFDGQQHLDQPPFDGKHAHHHRDGWHSHPNCGSSRIADSDSRSG